MKTRCLVLLLASSAILGCNQSPPMDARILSNAQDQQAIDTWYLATHLQGDIAAGVISARAIYPYQFDPGTARLTELGQRDLGILADYFKDAPSPMAVVRGDADDALFAARVAAVKDVLQRSGVDMAKVTVGDGIPGGRGISGHSIVSANKRDTGQFSGTSTDTGSLTREGMTSGETKGSNK